MTYSEQAEEFLKEVDVRNIDRSEDYKKGYIAGAMDFVNFGLKGYCRNLNGMCEEDKCMCDEHDCHKGQDSSCKVCDHE